MPTNFTKIKNRFGVKLVSYKRNLERFDNPECRQKGKSQSHLSEMNELLGNREILTACNLTPNCLLVRCLYLSYKYS